MKSHVVFTVIVLAATLCYGVLIQNKITVRMGLGVNVAQNLATVPPGREILKGIPQGKICDYTRYERTVDIYFMVLGHWDGDGCGGEHLALVSRDTIWKLNKTSSAVFSKTLDVSDTSIFSPAIIRREADCSLWQASCPYFTNPCGPSPPGTWTPSPIEMYLTKTTGNDYFLFRFVSRKTLVDSLWKIPYDEVKIETILQTNGSLDFKGVPVAASKPVQTRQSYRAEDQECVKSFGLPAAHSGVKIYDIRGRRVNGSLDNARNMRSGTMIYVIKNGESTFAEMGKK